MTNTLIIWIIDPFDCRYEALLAQEKELPQPQFQRQPEPEPVRHSQRVRQKRQTQPQYKSSLPAHLQELLKFQAQIPYVNGIPEHLRCVEMILYSNLRLQ